MRIKLLLISLFAIAGPSGCSTVQVPNTEACSVAGVLIAGADCSETTSNRTRSMSMAEFLDWLEPQAEVRDEKGNVTRKSRAGALCQSAEDYKRQKTAMEQACYKLGKMCSYEIKQLIHEMDKRIEKLQSKSGKNAD